MPPFTLTDEQRKNNVVTSADYRRGTTLTGTQEMANTVAVAKERVELRWKENYKSVAESGSALHSNMRKLREGS